MDREPLFHDWPLVVAGTRSRWTRIQRMKLTDLESARWIIAQTEIMPDGPLAETFNAIGRAAPKPTIVSNSLSLRNNLLAKDDFVTLVPGSVLRFGPGRHEFKVLPVKLHAWNLPICVTSIKGRTLSPAANLFRECARELARGAAKPR
jgi:DNA-binding transcriptional LysR family regulator